MTSSALARGAILQTNAFGKGVYGAPDALRLINFQRDHARDQHRVARQTIGRWLRGYDYQLEGGEPRHMEPLWRSDYDLAEDHDFEISFRDLIELRFVKSFRAYGLSLQTIRSCFQRAVDEVCDPRPFSTHKFRTDGKTIFLEITEGLEDPKLLDLRQRQGVFRSIVAPSFKDLEFDADGVARWFPVGKTKNSVVVDPNVSFGRPVVGYGVPTEVLRDALVAERSEDEVARQFDLPVAVVREAADFERRLAA